MNATLIKTIKRVPASIICALIAVVVLLGACFLLSFVVTAMASADLDLALRFSVDMIAGHMPLLWFTALVAAATFLIGLFLPEPRPLAV